MDTDFILELIISTQFLIKLQNFVTISKPYLKIHSVSVEQSSSSKKLSTEPLMEQYKFVDLENYEIKNPDLCLLLTFVAFRLVTIRTQRIGSNFLEKFSSSNNLLTEIIPGGISR